MKFIIHLNKRWASFHYTKTRGYAYDGNQLMRGRNLARFFARKKPNAVKSALLQANGFFSVVVESGRLLVAGVDRLRSLPLFYAAGENDFYLSDDAYWVAERVPSGYDELSVAEFAVSGHTWGKDTLYSKVKQLEAGEMLLAKKKGHVVSLRHTRYYDYVHHDPFTAPKQSVLAEWDAVLLRTFDRLIRSVNGRTIAVSLSGGYDSRLIAVMLRRLGYRNVICFTYGTPEHWEVGISRQVARGLGYQWEFIPYSHRLWHEAFHSKNFRALARFADGLTSLVPFQDWPALQRMKKDGILPKGSVIVPGHGIYTVTRQFLPPFNEIYGVAEDQIAERIMHSEDWALWDIRRLHGLWNWKTPPEELRVRLKKKALEIIRDIPREEVNVLSAEYWVWRERQPKIFVNWARAYEFLGYDWRMPLWDSEVMSFWEKVPIEYGLRKELCIDYVKRVQSSLGLDSIKRRLSIPKQFLKSMHLLETATRLGLVDRFSTLMAPLRRLSYKSAYRNDPHARYGIMSMEDFRTLYSRKPENVYSLLTLQRLGMISF